MAAISRLAWRAFAAVASTVLFSPTLAVGEKMYFTDRDAKTVYRANFDGSERETLFDDDDIPDVNTLRGIVVDVDAQLAYFCDSASKKIFRGNLNPGGTVEDLGVGGLGFPADITLDKIAGKLYWCDQSNNRIQRCNLDGTGIETLIDTASEDLTSPYFLFLDPAAGKLYWGDFSPGNIYRANLADGGGIELLVAGIDGQVRGVQLDPTTGYLYWVNRNGPDGQGGKIQRRLVEDPDAPVEDLYTGLDTPHGMALDIVHRKIYWCDTGTNGVENRGGHAVSRGDMEGEQNGANPMEILFEGSQPWDVYLDLSPGDAAAWRARAFGRNADEEALPDADPDLDGIFNRLERAFGLNPNVPDSRELPKVTLSQNAAQLRSVFRFRRLQGDAHGIRYLPEVSRDLKVWTTDQLSPFDPPIVVSDENGIEHVSFVHDLWSVENTPTVFWRLRTEE